MELSRNSSDATANVTTPTAMLNALSLNTNSEITGQFHPTTGVFSLVFPYNLTPSQKLAVAYFLDDPTMPHFVEHEKNIGGVSGLQWIGEGYVIEVGAYHTDHVDAFKYVTGNSKAINDQNRATARAVAQIQGLQRHNDLQERAIAKAERKRLRELSQTSAHTINNQATPPARAPALRAVPAAVAPVFDDEDDRVRLIRRTQRTTSSKSERNDDYIDSDSDCPPPVKKFFRPTPTPRAPAQPTPTPRAPAPATPTPRVRAPPVAIYDDEEYEAPQPVRRTATPPGRPSRREFARYDDAAAASDDDVNAQTMNSPATRRPGDRKKGR